MIYSPISMYFGVFDEMGIERSELNVDFDRNGEVISVFASGVRVRLTPELEHFIKLLLGQRYLRDRVEAELESRRFKEPCREHKGLVEREMEEEEGA